MIGFASLSTVLFLSLLPISRAAIGPQAELTISNKIIAPDGFRRSAVLAGGTFPGPLIRGNKGNSFDINVVNMLSDLTMERQTSIHWHGLYQKGTNYADGAAFVTQCPITSGDYYLYSFEVLDQAGTFWYHSHLSSQYCDGLRGPFVVYDPNDPHARLYDVDDESTVLTLADWYHIPAPSAGTAPLSDSTLFNGLGRWPGSLRSQLAVMNVQRGKRYRFRLISLACDSNFQFSIDGHDVTIIEADGENTVPLGNIDSLQIFAGQRYSFVLNANQRIDNYWIRADPDRATADSTGFKGGINSAILRYQGARPVEPTSTQNIVRRPLREVNLHPLTDPQAPGQPFRGGVDIALNLKVALNGQRRFEINGVSFVPPTVPVLLQILSGKHAAQELLPSGSVYTLPPQKTVEISIPAGVVGGPHPFHLHGHSFSVVRSAGSTDYNYVNPVKRDVVAISADRSTSSTDNVTIRFTTDNVGPWFLHCHIDWHLEEGMAIVFAEDPDHTAQRLQIPPQDAWNSLCPIYNALAPSQLNITTVTAA